MTLRQLCVPDPSNSFRAVVVRITITGGGPGARHSPRPRPAARELPAGHVGPRPERGTVSADHSEVPHHTPRGEGGEFWEDELAPEWRPPQFDVSRPHPYRMYNYLIGGKDHYQVDRDAAELLVKARPDTVLSVRAVEAFWVRAVTVLAREGMRQFLQLGTAIAIPNSNDNVARKTNPDSTFVYVADDPITTAHARALLMGRPNTEVMVISDDFRHAGRVLERADIAGAVDFSQPVGFLLFGMLDYIRDPGQARASFRALHDAAAPGSLFALLHVLEVGTPEVDADLDAALAQDDIELTPRPLAAVERILAGFEFLPPGLVALPRWRPDGTGPAPDLGERVAVVGGVVVKR